jgi:hypothetical protein
MQNTFDWALPPPVYSVMPLGPDPTVMPMPFAGPPDSVMPTLPPPPPPSNIMPIGSDPGVLPMPRGIDLTGLSMPLAGPPYTVMPGTEGAGMMFASLKAAPIVPEASTTWMLVVGLALVALWGTRNAKAKRNIASGL